MDAEGSEPEIKVTDRRRFSAEGETRDSGEEDAPPISEAASLPPEVPPLPPATFEFLVLSFRLQAEMALNLYAGEKGEPEPPDLEAARHAIDMLGVLQQKTRGNLTLEENRLIENSLTELRFRYVQASQKT